MTWPGSSPTDRSITMTRRGTAIWGAARPMPGAAYIVSIMSSRRARMVSSILSTGVEGACRIGCPYLMMGRRATRLRVSSARLGRPARQELAPARARRLEVVEQLGQGVAAELLEQRIRQHPRDHGLAHDPRR